MKSNNFFILFTYACHERMSYIQRCRNSVKQRKIVIEQRRKETRIKRNKHRGKRKKRVGKRERD